MILKDVVNVLYINLMVMLIMLVSKLLFYENNE